MLAFDSPATKQGFLIFLIVVAGFFRFFNLPATFQFQGDQGRDALIVLEMVRSGKPILLGPTTSLGNYYLGPLFYFLITPSLLLTNFDPVGPALFQAGLGTMAVAVFYLFAKRILSPQATVISSLIFALAPSLIIQSRFSWNPNPTPLFIILLFWSLYKYFQNPAKKWLTIISLNLMILWQLHYITLTLALVLPLIFGWRYIKKKLTIQNFIQDKLLILLITAPAILPLLASLYKRIFTEGQTGVASLPISINTASLLKLPYLVLNIVTTLFQNDYYSLLSILFMIGVGFGLYETFFKTDYKKLTKLKADHLTWISVAVSSVVLLVSLGLISGRAESHYMLSLFTLLILIFGKGWDFLLTKLKAFKRSQFLQSSLNFLLCLTILANLLSNLNVIFTQTGFSAEQIKETTQQIISFSSDQDFNFALIADNNERQSYLYFLELEKVSIPDTPTKQLFVVCEKLPCKPAGNPDWQIAQFESEYVDRVSYESIVNQPELPQIMLGTITQ